MIACDNAECTREWVSSLDCFIVDDLMGGILL